MSRRNRRSLPPKDGREVYDLFRRSTPEVRDALIVELYQWWIEQQWRRGAGPGLA